MNWCRPLSSAFVPNEEPVLECPTDEEFFGKEIPAVTDTIAVTERFGTVNDTGTLWNALAAATASGGHTLIDIQTDVDISNMVTPTPWVNSAGGSLTIKGNSHTIYGRALDLRQFEWTIADDFRMAGLFPAATSNFTVHQTCLVLSRFAGYLNDDGNVEIARSKFRMRNNILAYPLSGQGLLTQGSSGEVYNNLFAFSHFRPVYGFWPGEEDADIKVVSSRNIFFGYSRQWTGADAITLDLIEDLVFGSTNFPVPFDLGELEGTKLFMQDVFVIRGDNGNPLNGDGVPNIKFNNTAPIIRSEPCNEYVCGEATDELLDSPSAHFGPAIKRCIDNKVISDVMAGIANQTPPSAVNTSSNVGGLDFEAYTPAGVGWDPVTDECGPPRDSQIAFLRPVINGSNDFDYIIWKLRQGDGITSLSSTDTMFMEFWPAPAYGELGVAAPAWTIPGLAVGDILTPAQLAVTGGDVIAGDISEMGIVKLSKRGRLCLTLDSTSTPAHMPGCLIF